MKRAGGEDIPIWWEDIDDGAVFEKTSMMFYNRVSIWTDINYAFVNIILELCIINTRFFLL